MSVVRLKFRSVVLVQTGLYLAVALGLAAGCSRAYYKADADKEVYSIIDSKWQDDFGQKANYRISDSTPGPNELKIDNLIPPDGVLSLADAVAIATANNRDYQRRKEQLYLSALGLSLTRYQYAVQWFGTFDGNYAWAAGEEDTTTAAQLGVSKSTLFLEGAIFNIGLTLDWMRFLTGDPRTTLGSVLTGSAAIPILGTGAGKVARENLTQAERNVLYQIRSFNRYRKTFVVNIVNSYYRVLQQKDAVTNAERNYQRKVDSTRRLQMEAETGRKAQFDVDEAKQSELSARDSWIRARQRYEQSLDEFKLLLALPLNADIVLDQNELDALRAIGISQPDYSLDQAIETALIRRLDLATAEDQVDDAARKVILAEEGLGPELNVTGTTDVASKPDVDFKRLQFHEGTYGLGLDLDLPLDRKAERNAYREALISLTQAWRTYEEQTDRIELDVRQAYRDLREMAETYQIQKRSLELAQKRVQSNELLLDVGKGTVRLLLDSQDALVAAEDALTGALIDHTIAKLNFYRDIGILEVRPDGMWEHRRQWGTARTIRGRSMPVDGRVSPPATVSADG